MRLDELIPPEDLIAYASGCPDVGLFKATGQEFLNYFRDFGNLQPNARVLDLGCGCGRMALALAGYLDRTGSYEGMDIHQPSIDWAADNISPLFPNFRFQRADVANSTYNPTGKFPQHKYRLPYADGSFDFAFLTSIFTHMLPSAMENYLREVVRVLKVGGKCLITYFLLNEKSARYIQEGKSVFQFPHRYRTCAVQSAEFPEHVTGHDQPVVEQLFASLGMTMHCPIKPGKWSGNPDGVSFQDMVIAKKSRMANWKLAVRRLKPLWADRPIFHIDPTYVAKAA
jgi:ubiquinone/menaquinone biosynthesis C-methylase UbiE